MALRLYSNRATGKRDGSLTMPPEVVEQQQACSRAGAQASQRRAGGGRLAAADGLPSRNGPAGEVSGTEILMQSTPGDCPAAKAPSNARAQESCRGAAPTPSARPDPIAHSFA